MIQQESRLRVTDSSGARELLIIRVLGSTKRKYAVIGDIAICPVKPVQPGGMVEEGDVVKAVIIGTTKPLGRADGNRIRSDDNAAVIIKDDKDPVEAGIFGSVIRELRANNFMKIISLVPKAL